MRCRRNLQSMSPDHNDTYIKQLEGGVGGLGGPGSRDQDADDDEEAATTDSRLLSSIKLKLFGHCGVGKTTLVNSLRCGYIRALFRQLYRSKQGQGLAQGQSQGQATVQDVEEGVINNHEGCTRCIDVQRISVSGIAHIMLFSYQIINK